MIASQENDGGGDSPAAGRQGSVEPAEALEAALEAADNGAAGEATVRQFDEAPSEAAAAEGAPVASASTDTVPVDSGGLFVGGAILALLGASLLPLADGILARAAGSGPRIPGAVFFARWGFRHVGIAIVIGFLVSTLSATAFVMLDAGFLGMLIASQLLMVGVAVVAAAQARRLHPEGIEALGLQLRGAPQAALGGLMTYVLALPVLLGVMNLWPGLAKLVGIEVELQGVAQGIMELEGAALALAAFVAVVVAPFFEEVVFRGYIQPLLVQNLHAPAGIFVTSVLFASLHGIAFLPILALSMVLGWIQWRTHRTLACFVVHSLHNGGQLVLLFMTSAASA